MDPQVDSNQQYCLRWEHYINALLSTLPQLLDGDDLTDVTLSAGGRHLKAHRVVLSVCSDYFKQLFKGIDSMQHPVIVLPGVEFNDLYALVTFMYNGEVNVCHQQLSCLMSMAQTLNIRGLTEASGYPQDLSITKQPASNRSSPASSHASNTSKSKRRRLSPQTSTSSASGEQNLLNKSMPIPSRSWQDTSMDEVQDLSWKAPLSHSDPGRPRSQSSLYSYQTMYQTMSYTSLVAGTAVSPEGGVLSVTDLSSSLLASSSPNSSRPSSRPPRGGGTKLFVTCFICGKQLSNQYNLRVHMETHQNNTHACSFCNHVSRSRDALRKHVSYRHPNRTP